MLLESEDRDAAIGRSSNVKSDQKQLENRLSVNTSLYRELSCAVVSLLVCFVVVYIACESGPQHIGSKAP